VKKGVFPHLDSYSAFDGRVSVQPHPFDTEDTLAQLSSQPDLFAVLDRLAVRRLFVVGIATDYCVYFSVMDALGTNPARKARLANAPSVHVVVPAIQGVSRETTVTAMQKMLASGAELVTYDPANAPAHPEL
jgi:nicotinamidase-related amidase